MRERAPLSSREIRPRLDNVHQIAAKAIQSAVAGPHLRLHDSTPWCMHAPPAHFPFAPHGRGEEAGSGAQEATVGPVNVFRVDLMSQHSYNRHIILKVIYAAVMSITRRASYVCQLGGTREAYLTIISCIPDSVSVFGGPGCERR